MGHWDRATLDGVGLEYTIQGTGEPVVLVHAGVLADWFEPLLEEPALADHYRLLSYHRIGYAGSSHRAAGVEITDQATHCLALMRHVGIEQGHLVGHSSGGNIALQVALDRPDAVGSLALLEPALTTLPGVPSAPPPFVVEAVRRYGDGDPAGAVDAFLGGVCGPAWREVVEDALSVGAVEQAVADADTFFDGEQSAVRRWSFGPEQAARITQPVLAVVGSESTRVLPAWGKRQELLLAWLPNATPFVLPDATHLLHLQNPRGMAEALASFFAQHPLSGLSSSGQAEGRASDPSIAGR